MLQFQLVGYSHYGFTNDKGQYIEGYKFHVVRPPSKANNFYGNEATSITVSEQLVQKCGTPHVNQVYEVTYDQSGKIADYRMIQPGQEKIKGA